MHDGFRTHRAVIITQAISELSLGLTLTALVTQSCITLPNITCRLRRFGSGSLMRFTGRVRIKLTETACFSDR